MTINETLIKNSLNKNKISISFICFIFLVSYSLKCNSRLLNIGFFIRDYSQIKLTVALTMAYYTQVKRNEKTIKRIFNLSFNLF